MAESVIQEYCPVCRRYYPAKKIEKHMAKHEIRKIVIHGREYWLTKAECYEEFGSEDAEEIWQSAGRM